MTENGELRLFDLPKTVLTVEDAVSLGGIDRAERLARLARGTMSEHAAIVRLLERGHKVAKPVLDDEGADLWIDCRYRLQVKASTSSSHGRGNTWRFIGRSYYYRADGSRGVHGADVHGADFFLCHAVPADAWWIVPTERLRDLGRFTLTLTLVEARRPIKPALARLSADCLEAWELLE